MGEGVLSEPHVAGFVRRGGTLCCEEVPLPPVAEAAGTPTYVYSSAHVRGQYERLSHAFAGMPHRLHYSVKANSNIALLRLLRALGAGVDIVSAGELHRARLAGFRGDDIVFSGVGKTAEELDAALAADVRLINVESAGELELLARVAAARGALARVALRVNPEVRVTNPHAYIATGERGHKFGIPWEEAHDVAARAAGLPHVRLVGLDMHIGSQISGFDAYAVAIARVCELVDRLRAAGIGQITTLDVGGGLAVPYDQEEHVDTAAFAAVVRDAVGDRGLDLVLEPGRFLVANAGVLLTRVLYRKTSGGKQYVITDAGMNDLMRPSHYRAFHGIEPVEETTRTTVADVVGPVCESGDFFALGREVADVAPGALLAVRSAGAYGFVMASNYNSRPRAAEVLVDGDRWAVVTARETHEDLVRHERLTPEWRTT